MFDPYNCIQLKGRVLSNVNGEPICGAQVILKSRNFMVETDSSGSFHLQETGGGRPPKPIYLIRKDGYKDFEIEFGFSDSKVIYLVTCYGLFSKEVSVEKEKNCCCLIKVDIKKNIFLRP